MARLTRREFLESTSAAAAIAAVPALGKAAPTRRSAADMVELGKSGIKMPRLGMGTGTVGGRIQRELGQKGFDYLVRYAYDHGVRYIDTAQNYSIHDMVGKAIKGLPREDLFIQTKVPWNKRKDAAKAVDQYRKELGTDYIDSVLLHCVKSRQWETDLEKMRDELSEKKQRRHVRIHGASAHGLPGLRGLVECDWAEINLCRINPFGKHVDGVDGSWDEPGNVPAACKDIKRIHDAGRGVIGMKIIGEGAFKDPAQREKSMQFVMQCGFVDAIVIGFRNTAEIDEAIERMNRALNA